MTCHGCGSLLDHDGGEPYWDKRGRDWCDVDCFYIHQTPTTLQGGINNYHTGYMDLELYRGKNRWLKGLTSSNTLRTLQGEPLLWVNLTYAERHSIKGYSRPRGRYWYSRPPRTQPDLKFVRGVMDEDTSHETPTAESDRSATSVKDTALFAPDDGSA